MESVGNFKKLVWEKETPVRKGQNPRFFLTKKSVTLEILAKKHYNYAKAKFNAAYHI